MKGGLTAIICILGASWMGSSFFEGNQGAIVGAISTIVGTHPWVFAAGLFVLSILLFSQAATIAILAPVAVSPRSARAAHHRVISSGERKLFPPHQRHGAGRRLLRPDRHDSNRKVLAQPQFHAARVGVDRDLLARGDASGADCSLGDLEGSLGKTCISHSGSRHRSADDPKRFRPASGPRREGPAGREVHPGGCLLRRSDRPGSRKFSNLRRTDQPLSRICRGVGHGQVGRGEGEYRRWRHEERNIGSHRKSLPGRARWKVPRSVSRRLVSGRRWDLDEHECQRSACQCRARADGTQERRIPVR